MRRRLIKQICILTAICIMLSQLSGCGKTEETDAVTTETELLQEKDSEEVAEDTSIEEDAQEEPESIEQDEEIEEVEEPEPEEELEVLLWDFSDVKVGSEIQLGMYNQDNDYANGDEWLSWYVLDKQEDKMLVLCTEVVNSRSYIGEYDEVADINWETSGIRKWLNNEFLYTAFPEMERGGILDNTITDEDCGNPTTDKVFCLSLDEFDQYVGIGSKTNAKLPAKYGETAEKYVYGSWWLRTRVDVTDVDWDNNPREKSYLCYIDTIPNDYWNATDPKQELLIPQYVEMQRYVRPAMWISTKYSPEKSEETDAVRTTAENFAALNIGDTFMFGAYEQDGDYANGPEALEWLVLDKREDEIELTTIRAFDSNVSFKDLDLVGTSRVRIYGERFMAWLNNIFYNNAFNEAEKQCMAGTDEGIYVFLPSAESLINYSVNFPDLSFLDALMKDGSYTRSYFLKDGERITDEGEIKGDTTKDGYYSQALRSSLVRPVIRLKIDSTQIPAADSVQTSETEVPKVGDVITMGTYEQDGDETNGKEEIEWKVAGVSFNKVLLVSVYQLEGHPYNDVQEPVTWETCSLRNWLNNDFYNEAFTTDEKNRIIATDTSNKRFSDPIMDNVFCLTYDEMTEYKVSAKAQITEYLSNSDSIISLNTGDYWLRSLALNPSGNAYVSGGQGVVYDVVSSWKIGVRPAMWIEW